MLNKDQYNQDEYNDYYAQETRGAEISRRSDDEGGGKKIAIILLLLILIIAVGYFGWKSMNSSTLDGANISKNKVISKVEKTIEEPKATEDKEENIETPITPPASNQADEIAEQVQNITSSDGSNVKMNPEDIANIVQLVMMKMNKKKSKESTPSTPPTSTASPEDHVQNSQLVESLSGADVDSLSSISEGEEEKKPTLSKDVDIYNKIVLKDDKSNSNDALSQLSDEISSVIESEEDSKPTNSSDYTASITKEVKIRQKEMRYYIVKKGDTLGKVAKRFYGNVMDYKKIYEANPDILRRPDKIYIGQKLRIP
jgi:nucleoid-associated protein YgaU